MCYIKVDRIISYFEGWNISKVTGNLTNISVPEN